VDISIITPPNYASTSPTLAQVKDHLRIESSFTADDADLGIKRLAALAYVEQMTGRPLDSGVYEAHFDCWRDPFRLPYAPVTAIASVTYRDSAEATTTVSSADYLADLVRGEVRLKYGKSWPSVTLSPMRPITIRFTAGYVSGAPENMKLAVLLLMGHWAQNREAVILGRFENLSEHIKLGVDALLGRYVVDPHGALWNQ
jgi:uncharacterized phiE125 gp8 family phage protein